MLGEYLLAKRPTNVMHQLGPESRVPLYSLRHLLQGLPGGATLWIPRLSQPAALPGVLRAASHLRSVVGFCLQPDSPEPEEIRRLRPAELFRLAVEAAESTDRPAPFCLHVQLPALDAESGAAFEAIQGLVANCIETGFTSIGVDLRSLPPDRGAGYAAFLLTAAMELELGISVLPPIEGAGVGERVRSISIQLEALRAEGIEPCLVQVEGEDWPLASGIQSAVPGVRVAWGSLSGVGRPDRRRLPEILGAVLGDGILRRASTRDPARLEALAYAEAFETIETLGGHGAVEPVLASLESS
ncbi:MAG: hypothetical protein JXR96_20055 [Deltaproteobacteria bacterium]|nr:hypothetical protein [Deltaproteobacteria bacterium]